jgi:hypothetical protein
MSVRVVAGAVVDEATGRAVDAVATGVTAAAVAVATVMAEEPREAPVELRRLKLPATDPWVSSHPMRLPA